MKAKLFSYLGLFLLIVSCHSKDPKSSFSLPTIQLNPDRADTLKVSDYFDRVSALWLKDCLYSDINDFAEIKGQYLAETGYPDYLLFDIDGVYSGQLGTRGRGPGEYLSNKINLQISKDSTLLIVDETKLLEYTFDGKVVRDYPLKYKKDSAFSFAMSVPQTIIGDSLLVLSPMEVLTENPAFFESIKEQMQKAYLLKLYSINSGEIIQTYFPKKEIYDLKLFNQIYKYNDSLYFYHDKDQVIYQISPEGTKEKYRIDKGPYNKLQNIIEYTKTLLNQVPNQQIIIQSCNETDRYIMGKYVFKNRFYLFIYDKVKDETKNYKAIDNDLLGLTEGKQKKTLFDFQTGFKFKEDYVWTTADRNFLGILKESKSNMTPEEWKKFEDSHPDFAQIYKEFEKMGEALEEETPIVLIRYYFKS